MVIITVIMVIIMVIIMIIMVIITVTMVIIMVECLGISFQGKNLFGPFIWLTSDIKFSDFEPGCGPKTFFKFHENQTNRLQDIDSGRAKKRNVFYPHPL